MEKNEMPCWAALAIIAGLALVAVFIWKFPESSSEWAAWVQTIGSIVAIAGAVYAAREGAKATARLKAEYQDRNTLAVIEAFFDKVEVIETVLSEPHDRVPLKFDDAYFPSSLDGFLHTLSLVPVLELPTSRAVSAMLELQRCASVFNSYAKRLSAGIWDPGNPTHSALNKAMHKHLDLSKKYPPGAQIVREAKKELDDLISISFNSLKLHVTILATAIREQVDILRKELR